MAFRPKIGDRISIDGELYRFTEHPNAKGMPYGQTGRRATVYRVSSRSGQAQALKVFTLAFRKQQIAQNAKVLNQFAKLPGLEAAHRYVLSQQVDGDLLSEHPDLQYAVLMPWVDGLTWQEIVLSLRELTLSQSLLLAQNLTNILFTMEKRGMAHCDLSGPNVIVQFEPAPQTALVDLEDIYSEDIIESERKPSGSDGYAHLTAHKGLWRAEADRFAGAVLIAEMLAWCDEEVRHAAYGEQYFEPGEVQQEVERYSILEEALERHWGLEIASLFRKAWESKTLKGCPTFSDWQAALEQTARRQSAARVQLVRDLERDGELISANQAAYEAYPIDPEAIGKVWLPILMRLGGDAEDAGKYKLAIRYFEQAKDLEPGGAIELELKSILTRLKRKEIQKRQPRREESRAPQRQESAGKPSGGLNAGIIALLAIAAIWAVFASMTPKSPSGSSFSAVPLNQTSQLALPTSTLRSFTPTPRLLPTPTLRSFSTLTPTRSGTSSSISSCPGAPPQRLEINHNALVCTRSDSVYLREGPARNYAVVRRAPPGTVVSVFGGPVCADSWSWWEVELPSGYTGWMAEGGDSTDPYFLCPER
ncbi:MAG: SH3 domain-containing protein [Anaerolineales bacterium]|nr:SH3 domain-containing protein [Anaerolineales bacterium]